jgi:D-alanine-D-alanine ligase-like ATP-grasp enzyme
MPEPRHVAFVVPFRFETSLRFLRRALELPGVAVSLISQDPVESFAADLAAGRGRLAAHWKVDDAMDPEQLVAAVRGLSKKLGAVDRLIGVLEQLQVPLAEARAALGLPGLSVEAAQNFRDKSRMKDVLRAANIPCARHRLAKSAADVRAFLDEVGFPVIMKPAAGAGAVNTFRLDRAEQLAEALAAFPPNPFAPMLLEEFILGDEHSFDCVSIGGRPVWHSISEYTPGPLAVMQNEWIQWTVLLPRDIGGREYDPIRKAGAAALAALGMGTGLSHMEWFRRRDGSVAISEVGARPPGAQFTSLIGTAHDMDLYHAWARLMIFDQFDPPPRRWAVGAAYFRGQGRGHVKAVHGLDVAQREMGGLVVEVKLPKPGQPKSSSYEGEGYAILRHEDTRVVREALSRLVQIIRVELA